jgi:mono/diheme cytochrome c family protein
MRQIVHSTALLLFAAHVFSAAAQPAAAPAVTSTPVYVPDYTHQNDPLPNGVIAWDSIQKNTDATNGQDFARFVFTFTNVAAKVSLAQATNTTYLTNFTVVTNTGFWNALIGRKTSSHAHVTTNSAVVTVTNSVTPIPVTILSVNASCHCTTVELPPMPWLLPPGTNAAIRISVDLAGKSGILPKYVTVTTDKGKIELRVLINILPAPPAKPMSEEERARGIAAAKIDRQAVFRGDCASCHAKNVQGKYAQQLFAQVCAVCHEANPRATMVPDLHHLKEPTSEEFWRAWITSGKPGTLMPAFATAQGGPLDDMQIASLANYLNATIPSHVPPAPPAK